MRQKLQQASMMLFTQACTFVATLFTIKSHGHCTCTRRSWISQRYSCTHVHIIWYEVVSDHAHFAASILYQQDPICYRIFEVENFRGLRLYHENFILQIFYACMQYIYGRGHLPVRALDGHRSRTYTACMLVPTGCRYRR